MTLVRTRFAPSPTGFLHVGNIRTALFAWLLARHNGGQFILRIEDTDKKREVEGSIEHLLNCLASLGLDYDEGPDVGGPYAPYRQSERLEVYRQWARRLIDSGRAYADPYTPEQLQAFRDQAKKDKKAFLYRDHRPDNPPAWDNTTPLRFKSEPKAYSWYDAVMGDLSTGPEVIDDFILIKSDGFPTYNFAHIVDDFEMKVSHIIRGQEFISSQPNYLNLYEALDIKPPVFVTVPHILAESGNKKLGKRDGARDVLDYLRSGILPEALVNFIASLGWNDGTEQEIFSRQELIQKFDLSQIQRSGARFDEKRLIWMNGQHIRRLGLDDLYERTSVSPISSRKGDDSDNFWPLSASTADPEYKRQVLALAQDRLKTLGDLPGLTDYFFAEPTPNWSMIDDIKPLKKINTSMLIDLLRQAESTLSLGQFDAEHIQESLNSLLEITGQKPNVLFSLIRLAITWAPFSPALNETIAVLGRETTISRLQKAIDTAPQK